MIGMISKINNVNNKINLNKQSQKVSFGTKVFEVNNIDGIPCAYCGQEMISLNTAHNICMPDRFSDDLIIDRVRSVGHLLKPFQQQVLNYLTSFQYSNGYKSDGAIIENSIKSAKEEVSSDIKERFLSIVDIIERSSCKELKEKIRERKETYLSALMRKLSYEALMDFVRDENFLGIHQNSSYKLGQKINNVVSDIHNPNEFSSDSYIYDHAKKGSYSDFYLNLLRKSTSTIEHLTPKSKGGTNGINNYLAVCQDCNSKRGNLPFSLFISLNPQIVENTEKQLQLLNKMLPKLISERKISRKYNDYPQKVSETLKEISRGKLDVKI